jgi:glycosyltransferase involved in cell wall biosynthesis
MSIKDDQSLRDAPLVTIIIPIYNVEAVLPRCVDSALSQSYKNLEVVLVDDGSPDGCPSICDRYSQTDARIRVVHKDNGGLSDARNAGLDIAQGRFIFFLDADDFIDRREIEALYTELVVSDADAAIGGLVIADEQNHCFARNQLPAQVLDEHGYWSLYQAYTRSEAHTELVVSCGKLFRASLFQGLRFDVGKVHEDEFIIHRLIARCRSIVIADVAGYNYVQSPGSISHSRTFKSYCDIAEALLGREEYLESKQWHDFALTALSESRGALANALLDNEHALNDSRYNELRDLWSFRFANLKGHVHSSRELTLCKIFDTSPRLYNLLRKLK